MSMHQNVRYSDNRVNRNFVGGSNMGAARRSHSVGMRVPRLVSPKSPSLIAIGGRVAALRRQLGHSQEEFAADLGISRSYLAGIESGGERGGIEAMIALADALKVPLDWLVCRSVPPGGPLVGKFVDDPDELAWLAFWQNLTVEDRAAALRMLRLPPSPDKGA